MFSNRPKGEQRIAQAFRPGNFTYEKFALKGRPNGDPQGNGETGLFCFPPRRIKTVQTARASLATPGADSCSPPQEVFNGLIKCVWSFQVWNVPNVR